MKQLANRRKADTRLGDDVTFTRFVKLPGFHAEPSVKPAPADARGTRFPGRVLSPTTMANLLVSGHSNLKIGRDCRIGRLTGYWIYSLSFEERATCPRSCHHWQTCYGNNMPFAKRIDHTDPEVMPRLEAEISELLRKAARRAGAPGIIIRLHALGDFFSPEYVQFWGRMLTRHSKLVIFGYTAWQPDTPIGSEIDKLIDTFPERAMMRFSNGGLPTRSTVPIDKAEDCPAGAFVCPEQTGQFEACGKCGACWSTLKNVAFIGH